MGPSKPILTRDFNKFNTSKFLMSLSFEHWQDVFEVKEVNIMFNNFLNTYLKCFHSCFPLRKKTLSKLTQGPWITKGITISCRRKRELYILCKICNDQWLNNYYKQYCAILTKVISKTKKLYYNDILESNNKMRTTWRIINNEKGTTKSEKLVPLMIHEGKSISDQTIIGSQ